jgi:hypothetical protein
VAANPVSDTSAVSRSAGSKPAPTSPASLYLAESNRCFEVTPGIEQPWRRGRAGHDQSGIGRQPGGQVVDEPGLPAHAEMVLYHYAGPVLPRIAATAYLTPLREGGSLPGLVEADDDGTYVVKFTAAGQGPKALVAEIIVGELARAVGVRTPDLALIDVDAEIGRREPDEEVQELVIRSAGINLAVDFLPGSVGYDRTFEVSAEDADTIVWLDALVANVDRSARNTNLLIWHGRMWAIDHGACLRFHHSWGDPATFAESAYNYGDHVLAGVGDPRAVHSRLRELVTMDVLEGVLGLVPDEWLEPDPTRPDAKAPPDAAAARTAYTHYLRTRLDAAVRWLP